MTPPNANLSDEQRQTNRMRWLLTEAVGKTPVQMTVGVVNVLAAALVEAIRENGAVLVWMSSLEEDFTEEST